MDVQGIVNILEIKLVNISFKFYTILTIFLSHFKGCDKLTYTNIDHRQLILYVIKVECIIIIKN